MCILLDFICRSRIATGTMPQNPVAVTTIVSTDMVDAVAKHYGVELRRVLTGFKFIGEQIALLEQAGHPERFIFGFEESYGYLSGTHVRDKDGVNAVLLICEAAAWYARKGMTLGDAIDALYAEYGHYRNGLCSFAFGGAEGMAKMQSLMDGLRADAPKAIAGLAVESVVDYRAGRHRSAEGQRTGIPPRRRRKVHRPPLRHRAEDQDLSLRPRPHGCRGRAGRSEAESRGGRNDEIIFKNLLKNHSGCAMISKL